MKKNNILFVINPTQYEDYDILAIGDLAMLTKLYTVNKKYYHLIRKSKFGGIPILIIDTCDKLSDARKIINEMPQEK